MSASDMTISVMPYTVITDVDATPVVLSLALRVDGEATCQACEHRWAPDTASLMRDIGTRLLVMERMRNGGQRDGFHHAELTRTP